MSTHGRFGLRLSRREGVVLAICAFGLLVAWLTYGMAGLDAGERAYGVAESSTSPLASHSPVSASPVPSNGPQTPEPAASIQVPPAANTAEASPAALAEAPVVTPTAPPAAGVPVASAPLRITYPAAGIDVAIHSLEPDSNAAGSRSIEPPATKDGYWLAPFGSPGAGSTNTTYVVGHSWVDQDAPFNHLSWAASPGDEFTVATAAGVLAYRVDSVATYSKSMLKDSPIWDVVPNRVVLISCYSADPWGQNVVVVASPDSGR